jgi:hypothetical protein
MLMHLALYYSNGRHPPFRLVYVDDIVVESWGGGSSLFSSDRSVECSPDCLIGALTREVCWYVQKVQST